jgi:hypothetical protein
LISAMVERKWNLPPLTPRDAAAAGLAELLDVTQPPSAGLATVVASRAGSAQLAPQTCGPGHTSPAGISDNRLVNAAPRCA